MPALTHGRVKNGFNGGRRLKQAKNCCPKSGNLPVPGRAGDASRRNATIGGIGSRNISNRAAIKRKVCFTSADGKKICN
tara:strand:+ start:175 stop:411 length:237 start_codon:yes stop_codon:yes gene_type:complete